MNNLFSQLSNILWSHTRPPDRDTRSLLVTHHRPSRRQPRWWTNECFRALVARNSAWRACRRSGLFQITLTSLTRCAFWRQWQHHIQQIHNRNPRACASQIRRFFRLPPRIDCALHCGLVARPGRFHPTAFPRATDGGRISRLWPLPRTLVSSHFVDLTSASSSGPFDAPFSAPELAQALAQCHDSAPGHDGPCSAFKPRGGVACCSNFSTWSALEHGAGGVEDQHSRSCVQTWRNCKCRAVPPSL